MDVGSTVYKLWCLLWVVCLHVRYVSTVSGPGADTGCIHCIWTRIRGQPSSPGPVTILSFSPVGACAHKHGSLMRATCAVWSEMAMIHDTGGWGVPRKYRALVCGVVANTRDDTLSTQTHVSLTKPDLPRNQRARISPAGERCSTKRRGTLDRTFRDTTAIITLRSI